MPYTAKITNLMCKDAEFKMRTFQFRLRNGEIHQLAFQDGGELHRAIIWVPKNSDDEKKEVANCIILSDEVETVEFIDERLNKQATAR